jgi:acetyltransferase
MFASASAFATQPLPRGKRVAIVTNAGGPGILATDACVSLGLEMPELSEPTRDRLRAALFKEASLRNPVDVVAGAGPEHFEASIRAVLDDPGVDALLVIFVTPVYVDSLAVARAIVSATVDARVPVQCCFMGKERQSEAVATLRAAGIPVHAFPEAMAKALADMVRYTAFHARDPGTVPEIEADEEAARAVVAAARGERRTQLTFDEGRRLVKAFGLPFVRTREATGIEQVLDAAADLGFPLVLKASARSLSHKTDRGGVAVDLRNVDELARAWRRMRDLFTTEHGDLRFLVQSMARGDREVILGMRQDKDFGPLLMFGLGGIHVEVLRDVAFRVHPITDADARDMIRSLRGHALLSGVRGAPPVPEDLLIEIVLRLDRLVGALPEIQEIDLNPIMVGGRREDCAAVDVRVTLAPPPAGAGNQG